MDLTGKLNIPVDNPQTSPELPNPNQNNILLLIGLAAIIYFISTKV